MTIEENGCVKRVYENMSLQKCMTKCDGLMVTSYEKEILDSPYGLKLQYKHDLSIERYIQYST